MSREESNKIKRKRKLYEIKNDEGEKSINWSKNSSQKESQEIENLSKFQIRKRMFKSISEDSHKLIKINKRSTLTEDQLEDCFWLWYFYWWNYKWIFWIFWWIWWVWNKYNTSYLYFQNYSKWNRWQLSFSNLK